MENKQRASTGGRRPIRLALGVVGVIVLAAGAYAGLRGPLGGVQIASSARAETGPAPNASMRTVTIPVEGMSCGSCAARIKKTLKAVDGVASAEVSLERREVLVRYAPGRSTNWVTRQPSPRRRSPRPPPPEPPRPTPA